LKPQVISPKKKGRSPSPEKGGDLRFTGKKRALAAPDRKKVTYQGLFPEKRELQQEQEIWRFFEDADSVKLYPWEGEHPGKKEVRRQRGKKKGA